MDPEVVRLQSLQRSGEGVVSLTIKQYETHQFQTLMLSQETGNGAKRDLRRLIKRIAVDARAYGWECYGPRATRVRDLQTPAVGAGQQFRLTVVAAPVDWPHRMNNVLRLEVTGCRDLGIACLAAAYLSAILKDGGTTRTVDSAVNAAASQKAGVGGVDNHISVLVDDVALH